MICRSDEHSKILMKLRCATIPELLVDASDNLKSVFELMEWNASNCAVSLNCFIQHTNITWGNGHIGESQENFFDINPLCGNHLFLIFIDFVIVPSRISVNYLYKNLSKRWKLFALPEHRPLDNVYVEHIVRS